MQGFISKAELELLKKTFPTGSRVELVQMNDEFNTRLKPGEKGTVKHIDDIGTVFVSWDCGSGLGVVYGEDIIRKIE